MNTHRVDVFNEADRDHLIVRVPDDLQFQFLPAQNRLFDQDLANEAGPDSAVSDDPQFLLVPGNAPAPSAERIRRSHHNRVAQTIGNLEGFFYGVGGCALRHGYAQFVHRILEGNPVLPALNGIRLYPDDLDAVFLKDAPLGEFRSKVEACLPSEVGKQAVGFLLFYDFRNDLNGERLDVREIGHPGVRHNGGGVGVDKHDLVPGRPQGLARLRARIVEFARLPYDDGP